MASPPPPLANFRSIYYSADGKSSESADNEERLDSNRPNASTKKSEFVKDASPASPPTTSDSAPKGKGANISEKAAVLLKKKVPSLTDKELNPEFFQNLETRTNDLAVEVVVPRKYLQTQGGDEPDRDYKVQENQDGSMDRDLNQSQVANNQSSEKRFFNKMQIADDYSRDKWTEQRGFRGRDLKARMGDVDDKNETNQRDSSSGRLNISRSDGQANWLAIQRQLSQLERQQTSLMNMLQVSLK